MTQPMPVVFVGHGNPMNAVLDNAYTRGWAALGEKVPRPKAILCVSAHWYIRGTSVTAMPHPRTIHDFGGFPPELYRIDYPAPGDPALAERVRKLLAPMSVTPDQAWGLDHGTWTVLRHVFPEGGIPVVQLSIDRRQPPEFHFETGKRLGPLRDDGVLVLGSGNLVHNLHAYAWGQHTVEPYGWAVQFERKVREHLLEGDPVPLIGYEAMGREAELSIPTPDHYLPLLYVIALRRDGDPVGFPVEGVDGGSVSMLAVRIG
jgi:4,5-DOPA dioxygenase extradiol